LSTTHEVDLNFLVYKRLESDNRVSADVICHFFVNF
jgi:hypothetical protein